MPTVPTSSVGDRPSPEMPDPTYLMIAAAQMHEQGRLIESGDTMDADGWMHHREKLQRAEPLLEHNQMKDYYRSIDDIVKEGSNPKADSGFSSSSPRDRKR